MDQANLGRRAFCGVAACPSLSCRLSLRACPSSSPRLPLGMKLTQWEIAWREIVKKIMVLSYRMDLSRALDVILSRASRTIVSRIQALTCDDLLDEEAAATPRTCPAPSSSNSEFVNRCAEELHKKNTYSRSSRSTSRSGSTDLKTEDLKEELEAQIIILKNEIERLKEKPEEKSEEKPEEKSEEEPEERPEESEEKLAALPAPDFYMSDSEEEAMCRKCRNARKQKRAIQLKWFKFALCAIKPTGRLQVMCGSKWQWRLPCPGVPVAIKRVKAEKMKADEEAEKMKADEKIKGCARGRRTGSACPLAFLAGEDTPSVAAAPKPPPSYRGSSAFFMRCAADKKMADEGKMPPSSLFSSSSSHPLAPKPPPSLLNNGRAFASTTAAAGEVMKSPAAAPMAGAWV